MRSLLCRIRSHRPDESLGDDLYRCRCQKVTWRRATGPMVLPDTGLVWGYEKVLPPNKEKDE